MAPVIWELVEAAAAAPVTAPRLLSPEKRPPAIYPAIPAAEPSAA